MAHAGAHRHGEVASIPVRWTQRHVHRDLSGIAASRETNSKGPAPAAPPPSLSTLGAAGLVGAVPGELVLSASGGSDPAEGVSTQVSLTSQVCDSKILKASGQATALWAEAGVATWPTL